MSFTLIGVVAIINSLIVLGYKSIIAITLVHAKAENIIKTFKFALVWKDRRRIVSPVQIHMIFTVNKKPENAAISGGSYCNGFKVKA